MSSGEPPRDVQGDPRRSIQSYPPALHTHTQSNNDRQPSMSVGYLTLSSHNRDHPPDYINNHFIYTPSAMPQQNSNISQQQQQQQQPQPQGPLQAPQQTIRDHYERAPTGPPSHAGSASSAAASAQQTPRITLPPLSAITDNSDSQVEGPSTTKASQIAPSSSAPPSFPPQQQPPPQPQPPPTSQPQQPQQQQQPPQPQHPQAPQGQQHPQPSPPYPSRPPSQYDSQQGPYPPSQRHLQPSPQQPPDQSRYPPGPGMPQQVPMQQHPMPMQLQPNPQMGQFPSPSPNPQHFQPQSQYAYPPQQYPTQSMYGQYPPPQMQQQMPPGIPYQPAYATSHRQRPPQFNPYPPPHAGFGPPPQGPPQGWPQQDYIAQPLTPLTAPSPQQPYSPQLNQMSAGGPLRTRRTSSGLSQPSYPPPSGEPPQPAAQPQSNLKPKRKRATSGQLRVLNSVFQSTFFPSTELRIALGKELNMSPRTVQIWFQNKRQSWRATKAKEHGGSSTQQPSSGTAQTSGTPSSSQTYGGSSSFSPHPLRQDHFAAAPSHARMPSSAEESGREEGMENDEGGGWEALRQAQQEHRDYRPGLGSADPEDDVGFDDELHSPHHRHR